MGGWGQSVANRPKPALANWVTGGYRFPLCTGRDCGSFGVGLAVGVGRGGFAVSVVSRGLCELAGRPLKSRGCRKGLSVACGAKVTLCSQAVVVGLGGRVDVKFIMWLPRGLLCGMKVALTD